MQDKLMVVVLPMGLYDAWLDAPVRTSTEFVQMFPASELHASVSGVPMDLSSQLQSQGSLF